MKVYVLVAFIFVLGGVLVLQLTHKTSSVVVTTAVVSQPPTNIPTTTSVPTPLIPATATPTIEIKNQVLLDVPFTVQSPLAEWKDPLQQDACEEASMLMAMHWVKNQPILSKQAAKDEILAEAKYQQDTFGDARDTSTKDTAKRILEGYYKFSNYQITPVAFADDIIHELDQGHLVIVPANGQKLGNPNFTPPGPERHMVVIKGYDRTTSEFITNDTGISQGANWRYAKDILFNAIRDYKTGYHIPIPDISKVMIVIYK